MYPFNALLLLTVLRNFDCPSASELTATYTSCHDVHPVRLWHVLLFAPCTLPVMIIVSRPVNPSVIGVTNIQSQNMKLKSLFQKSVLFRGYSYLCSLCANSCMS